MDSAAPHLIPIIQCALIQGMRLEEILGLKISDVDFDSDPATITIRPENNKTGKEDIIPVRSKMKAIFQKLIIENHGRSEFMFNYFDPETEKIRNIKTCKRSFRATCKRAGIEKLQFRDLRRTCSTRLHEDGVDPLIIQRLLRHSTFRMTGEVYIQSSLKMMKTAFDKSDNSPGKSPKIDPNWNIFRTRDQKSTDSTDPENVKCLFSMN